MKPRVLLLGMSLGWLCHLAMHWVFQHAMYEKSVVSHLLAPSAATPPWALALALGFLYLRLAAQVVFPVLIAACLAHSAIHAAIPRAQRPAG
ncbi:MAG TPA: hypothetical protein PKA88_03535 [Polyangiaceae bacterium]|nr:hypothetical protein [Polyangiaceae bacterium]